MTQIQDSKLTTTTAATTAITNTIRHRNSTNPIVINNLTTPNLSPTSLPGSSISTKNTPNMKPTLHIPPTRHPQASTISTMIKTHTANLFLLHSTHALTTQVHI